MSSPARARAFVRTKLKHVLTGKVVDKTFNAGIKVETANVDKRGMQYSYKDGDHFVFMDMDTYDQLFVSRPWSATPRSTCWRASRRSSRCTTVCRCTSSCPASVELIITETEPGLQGDRSTGGTKPATLETGAEIQVPLFITTGEKVKVDTRDGELPRPGEGAKCRLHDQGPHAGLPDPLRGRPPRRRPAVGPRRLGGPAHGTPSRTRASRRSASTRCSWSRAMCSTLVGSTS